MTEKPRPEVKVTHRTHASEIITLRVDHEWGFFIVDEQTGLFHAQTSFGDYSYVWGHHGSASLKLFLAELDYSYFMGKCHPGRGKRFDYGLTIKNMRERILAHRKEQFIDMGQARTARQAIIAMDREFSAHTHEHVLFHVAYNDDDIHAAMGDFDGLAAHVDDAQCRGFWDKLWPHFLNSLQQVAPANGN